MPIQKIIKHPHDTLRKTSREVSIEEITTPKFQQFCQDLVETLEAEHPLGAGLSANQIDDTHRVFAINLEIDDDVFMKQLFINPKITEQSKEELIDWEGCLSIPDQWAKVKRYASIKLKALSIEGKPFEINASDFYARLLQHELDHLNGVLFIDKLESPLINTAEFEQQYEQEKESVG